MYRAADLAVKGRFKRKGVMAPREPLLLPDKRNKVSSMDFVMDSLANGRRLKVLTIVNDCTKEAVDLGKFRDGCLNEHWFHTPEHARVIIGQWRQDYIENRPHSMLGYKTPAEVAELLRNHVD